MEREESFDLDLVDMNMVVSIECMGYKWRSVIETSQVGEIRLFS